MRFCLSTTEGMAVDLAAAIIGSRTIAIRADRLEAGEDEVEEVAGDTAARVALEAVEDTAPALAVGGIDVSHSLEWNFKKRVDDDK